MKARRNWKTSLNCTHLEAREVPTVGMVADLDARLPTLNQTAADFRPVTLNGFSYFVINTSGSGSELGRSDGTTASTSIVADLSPGSANTTIDRIVATSSRIVFSADIEDGTGGSQLFVSDGTAANTKLLGSSPTAAKPSPITGLAAAGNSVYYGAWAKNPDGNFRQTAWQTDVVNNLTFQLETASNPLDESDNFVPLNGKVIFTAAGPGGRGLYVASPSTTLSAEFLTGTTSDRPFQNVVKINSDFAAMLKPTDSSFSNYELWVTDGRGSSTRRISMPSGTTLLGGLVAAGGKAFFTARGTDGTDQLWVTDGFVSNTVMLKSGLNPESPDAPLRILRTDGSKLYFPASDGEHGIEPWVSDGTAAGTKMIADLAAGSTGSMNMYYNTVAPLIPQPNGIAYFHANNGGSGGTQPPPNFVLYRTDGTAAGTYPVEKAPTVANLAVTSEFYVGSLGDRMLFRGGGGGESELWLANPTPYINPNQVSVLTPTASPNPVNVGQPITFNTAVTTNLGSEANNLRVRFEVSLGDATLPLPLVPIVNSIASYTGPATLAVNNYQLRAVVVYLNSDGSTVDVTHSGDGGFRVTDPNNIETTTTLKITMGDPGLIGSVTVFEATVAAASGSPNGRLQFTIGDTDTQTVDLVQGSGRVRRTLTPPELFALASSGISVTYLPQEGTPHRTSMANSGRMHLPGSSLGIGAPNPEPNSIAPNERAKFTSQVSFIVPGSAGMLEIPTTGLTVQFVVSSASGTQTLPATTINDRRFAIAEAQINLPVGQYTVKAVVKAGPNFVLLESDSRTLTIRSGEPGNATRIGPRLYQSASTSTTPSRSSAAAAIGNLDSLSGASSYTNYFGSTFEAALGQLGLTPSQLNSMTMRYLTPLTGNDSVADEVWVGDTGSPGAVIIRDGVTGEVSRAVLPFELSFKDGVLVTAGDLNNDGQSELVFTPDNGGSGRTVVYDPASGLRLADFFGIDDPNFRGGARAAVTLLDGVLTLLIAAGNGGGPRLAAFEAASVFGGGELRKLFGDIFLFEQALRNGAYITGGDVNGDGTADLIAGGGPDGGPRVFVLDGAAALRGEIVPLANFFAGDISNRNGVKVKAVNLDGDDLADIITANPKTGIITAYLGKELTADGTPPAHGLDEFLDVIPV